MTIHRPTAKALASAFLVACSHGTAAAAGYDLDCAVLGDDGQPRRNTAALHLQVDQDAGRWCDGRCVGGAGTGATSLDAVTWAARKEAWG